MEDVLYGVLFRGKRGCRGNASLHTSFTNRFLRRYDLDPHRFKKGGEVLNLANDPPGQCHVLRKASPLKKISGYGFNCSLR